MEREYDPHLLYKAINITVELEYQVPMTLVYKIIEKLHKRKKKNEKDLTEKELIELVRVMGLSLQDKIDKFEDDTKKSGKPDLKTKIKQILSLLNCELSNAELNSILKGEISIEDVLNKQAQIAWRMIFEIGEDGKSKPDQEMVNWMNIIAEDLAIENLHECRRRLMLKINEKHKQMNDFEISDGYNIKISQGSNKTYLNMDNKLKEMDKKLRKLKLYIAHLQGYDRSLDHDGERGVDPETGEIRDFGDIYLADKRYSGAIIEDIEYDGIDIEDIK